VAALFREHGSNAWFEKDPDEILPVGLSCPNCGGTRLTKENDTLDGWFDSGSSHAAVLEKFEGLRSPADIYLEGGDQYRGWFQSSMLTSVATRGRAPYRRVITHGWTVDSDGRAMHKSLGNAVSPEEIIRDYGADVLRLWVASSDYRADARISKNILGQLSDIYLKIRNTSRYILGNLDGFDPDSAVEFCDMRPLDRWAVCRVNDLTGKVLAAYENYEYHPIYHGIHNFCAVDMSNFYLDVIKDRLYCDLPGGASRRSAQSAIFIILDRLARLLAPILAFTADEIWRALPRSAATRDCESALLAGMPAYSPKLELTREEKSRWDTLLELRACVNKALELARAEKIIGKPLDAEVRIYFGGQSAWIPEVVRDARLDELCIVSKLTVCASPSDSDSDSDTAEPGYEPPELPGVVIAVSPSRDPMCARCWTHDERVGSDARYSDLCPRCADVVSALPG
jgi:isoleucyl-tRNA synthetase